MTTLKQGKVNKIKKPLCDVFGIVRAPPSQTIRRRNVPIPAMLFLEFKLTLKMDCLHYAT